MYKLIIKLKQHTPLIHFQNDQSGATLRATELKPKLDKFLKKYVFKDFEDNLEKYKEYLIGYDEKEKKLTTDKKAFDYKVRIKTYGDKNNSISIPDKNLYFGNMDAKKKKREEIKAVFNTGKIEVTFLSLKNEEIIKKIEENIAKFFAVTNFGARQNKGFGSFYIEGDSNFKENVRMVREKFLYVKYNDKCGYRNIMNDISVIYPLMKSGLNFPDFKGKGREKSYRKSFLFQYMLDKDIGNEKRFIKENFFRPKLRIEKDGMDKKYVRALLGVCEKVEFRHDRKGTIVYKSDNIERFKSPITFKIVNNELAIIPEEIPDEVYNKKFEFIEKVNNKNIKEYKKTIKEYKKTIYTPKKEDVNTGQHLFLEDFLFAFAKYFRKLEITDKNNPFESKIREAKKNINVIEEVGESND